MPVSAPKPTKTIYLVRHGESEGNVGTVYQDIDSPLTERGHEQARFIADRLARLPFDALISSPVLRAKQTAEAITAATGIEPEYSSLFAERIKPTGLAGLDHADPRATALLSEWEESLFTPGMRVPGGDNFDDLSERTSAALAYLSEHESKTIVVVSHGFFLRTLFARIILGKTYRGDTARAVVSSMTMNNTGLSAIRLYPDRENPWQLWIVNDHAHLG